MPTETPTPPSSTRTTSGPTASTSPVAPAPDPRRQGGAAPPNPAASTPGTLRKAGLRKTVRRKPTPEILTAYQLTDAEAFLLPSGDEVIGRAGWWVVCREQAAIDVCTEALFVQRYEPAERKGLLLSEADRTVIERTLGLGSTETPQHLVTAIDRMARLVIGTIELEFTPGQWEEIAHRAEKRGRSVEQYVRQIVDKVLQDFWSV